MAAIGVSAAYDGSGLRVDVTPSRMPRPIIVTTPTPIHRGGLIVRVTIKLLFYEERVRGVASGSAGSTESVLDGLGMPRYDGEENSRGTVRTRSPLFPVSERRRLEAKTGRELGLAQMEFSADRTNVDRRHLNSGNADWDIFASRPGNCFLQAGDDLASGGVLRARLPSRDLLLRHGALR
jgi:hypothetical protein